LLAEALALAGEIEEALAALDNALAQAAVSGARGWNAEIHRLCGELSGRLPYPDPAKAEDSFRTALAIAREQGTRGYELRAATSLARLWGEQGRRGEGRDLLTPLYGWFTEGFNTADLKKAKRLLDELTLASRRPVRGLMRMTVSSATRRSCARPQVFLRLASQFQPGRKRPQSAQPGHFVRLYK
jgi:predicted ATPase